MSVALPLQNLDAVKLLKLVDRWICHQFHQYIEKIPLCIQVGWVKCCHLTTYLYFKDSACRIFYQFTMYKNSMIRDTILYIFPPPLGSFQCFATENVIIFPFIYLCISYILLQHIHRNLLPTLCASKNSFFASLIPTSTDSHKNIQDCSFFFPLPLFVTVKYLDQFCSTQEGWNNKFATEYLSHFKVYTYL